MKFFNSIHFIKSISKKSSKNIEYDNYLAQYALQFSNMSIEQLQEEAKTINHLRLSINEKFAKHDALKNEFEHRNIKYL